MIRILLILLIPAIAFAAGVAGVENPASVSGVSDPDKVAGVSGLAAGGGSPPADVTIRPTTDTVWGPFTGEWSSSAGSDEYAMVDEVSADDDTTYIYIQDNGGDQGFDNLPTLSAGTILGVAIHYRAKEQAGSMSLYPRIRVNGVVYSASPEAVTGSYANYSYEWTTNPNTGIAWTETDVEGSGSNPLATWAISAAGMVGPSPLPSSWRNLSRKLRGSIWTSPVPAIRTRKRAIW